MQIFTTLLTCCICLLAFTGCRNTDESRMNVTLSVIQQKYAPDSTIALFDIEVRNDSGLIITGETSVAAAFRELDSVVRTNYPEAEFNVTLLPSSTDSLTWGLINVSVANLRATPKHRSELVTQAVLGTPAKVLKKSGSWCLIQTPDHYLGWITGSSIRRCTEPEIRMYNRSDRIIFTALAGTCYSSPDENSLPVSDLVAGCILKSAGGISGFLYVQFPDGRNGFVRKQQCLSIPEWNKKFQEMIHSIAKNPETVSASTPFYTDLARKIIESAMMYHGIPYLWGGTSSKGLDCSGFTKSVYFMNGILLQRDASQQVLYGEPIDTSANLSFLLPADLLFFGDPATDSTSENITHTGIYIGNGEVIHASSGTGRVGINSLLPGRKNYNEHLDSIFICARRILTCVGTPGIESVFSSEFYNNEELSR